MNRKETIESIMATLPLNANLNASFGKVVDPLLEEKPILERMGVLLPQAKLVIDELEETIFGNDIALTLDGIGDIITTADGYFYLNGLQCEEEFVEEFLEINEVPEEIDFGWSVAGLQYYNDECSERESSEDCMASVVELMFADFQDINATYGYLKSYYDVSMKYAGKVDATASEKLSNTYMANGWEISGVYTKMQGLTQAMSVIRERTDAYCRSLGFDPVKVLEEVYKSNMSKFCESPEDAEATIAKYKDKGLTDLEIVQCEGMERWFVRTTADCEFKGQMIPKGKFMKGVHFKEPDWSDLTRFELYPTTA